MAFYEDPITPMVDNAAPALRGLFRNRGGMAQADSPLPPFTFNVPPARVRVSRPGLTREQIARMDEQRDSDLTELPAFAEGQRPATPIPGFVGPPEPERVRVDQVGDSRLSNVENLLGAAAGTLGNFAMPPAVEIWNGYTPNTMFTSGLPQYDSPVATPGWNTDSRNPANSQQGQMQSFLDLILGTGFNRPEAAARADIGARASQAFMENQRGIGHLQNEATNASANMLNAQSTRWQNTAEGANARAYEAARAAWFQQHGTFAGFPEAWGRGGGRVPTYQDQTSAPGGTGSPRQPQPEGQGTPSQQPLPQGSYPEDAAALSRIVFPIVEGAPPNAQRSRVPIGTFMQNVPADYFADRQRLANLLEYVQNAYASASGEGNPGFAEWWQTSHPAFEMNDQPTDLARRRLEDAIRSHSPNVLDQRYGGANWFSPIARWGTPTAEDRLGIRPGQQRSLFGNRGSYYNRPLPTGIPDILRGNPPLPR